MSKAHYLVYALFGISLLGQSCTEQLICPAYQSAFIHDKEKLEQQFSYFNEDSTPKVFEASSKNRFLIIEQVSYKKKLQSLQTIPMVDVYPVMDDSLAFDDEIPAGDLVGYDSSAVISIDTTASFAIEDSIYVISLKKEKFNIDQELYLWYLKDYIVYPDVRLQLTAATEAAGGVSSGAKRKNGFFGFFKNLFRKKNRNDSTAFDQETSATELDQAEPKKKKGLFSFLKKKKNKNENPEQNEESNNEEGTPPDDEEGDF